MRALALRPGGSIVRIVQCVVAAAAGAALVACAHREAVPTKEPAYETAATSSEPTPRNEVQVGYATWYGAALAGHMTASGERFDPSKMTAAHRSLPLSSYARVTSLDNGRSVIVKINDRGPQPRRFIIDLSPRAADEIDMRRVGVAAVIVEPVVFGPAPPTEPAPTVAELHSSGMPMEQ